MNRYRFKTKPYPHQLSAFKRFLRQGYLGVLWHPGVGKTKLIVDVACALRQRDGLERVLIVCPLSVVGVWKDEFKMHAPTPYRFRVFDKDCVAVDWKPGKLNIVVLNYDIGWRRSKAIKKYKPQMVVADESHRIKKPSARRSRWVRTFKRAKYRAILTGTPAPKSYMDLYAQWVFLNFRRFGTDAGVYRSQYIIMGGYMGKQIKGHRNVKELNRKIKADATIRTKKVLNLPPERFQRVPVDLEKQAWVAYQKMEYEMLLELEKGEISDAKNAAVRILRLQQITGGWIKSDEGNLHVVSQAKLRSCNERLENLWYGDERVVVFARFTPEVHAVADLGKRARLDTYLLDGSTRREDRDDIRKEFQARPGPSLFVAQIQTGGLGITLHSAAEGIFYSVTYAYDDYFQACSRLHRSGQVRSVRYQHLIVPGTVDSDIYVSLKAKEDLANTIMKDPKKYARHLRKRLESRH